MTLNKQNESARNRLLTKLKGKTQKMAQVDLLAMGFTSYIRKLDGEVVGLVSTNDYSLHRVGLDIKDGIVVDLEVG